MKVLITGAKGQVGRALVTCAPVEADVVALDRSRLDLTDHGAIRAVLRAERPDIIINAAAYTAVDRAESEEALATRINGDAVAVLAEAARDVSARLVQISTDFVFDGSSGRPYAPDAPPAPLGVYGRSKLAGERAAGPEALIVRTAWVYDSQGANFVRTMLRLMAEKDALRVVADQVGTPSWASDLARALWKLVERGAAGTLHYTDSGVASWYDFAVAIQEEAIGCGLLTRAIPVIPIPTADYPTPARRPPCVVLDKEATWEWLGGPAPHWRHNLRLVLKEMTSNG